MLIMALLHIPSPVPVSNTSFKHVTECAGKEPSLRMPVPISGVWSPIIFGESQKYFSSYQQHSCCSMAWDPSCSFSQDWFGPAGIDLFCRAFPQPWAFEGLRASAGYAEIFMCRDIYLPKDSLDFFYSVSRCGSSLNLNFFSLELSYWRSKFISRKSHELFWFQFFQDLFCLLRPWVFKEQN